jgi:hypothetical protein
MAAALSRQKKGAVIRAAFLNDIAGRVDDLALKFVDGPKQVVPSAPAGVQNEAALEEDEIIGAEVFIETSRATDLVQVFDQNDENYAEIDRISEVVLQKDDGTTIILRFTN